MKIYSDIEYTMEESNGDITASENGEMNAMSMCGNVGDVHGRIVIEIRVGDWEDTVEKTKNLL